MREERNRVREKLRRRGGRIPVRLLHFGGARLFYCIPNGLIWQPNAQIYAQLNRPVKNTAPILVVPLLVGRLIAIKR